MRFALPFDAVLMRHFVEGKVAILGYHLAQPCLDRIKIGRAKTHFLAVYAQFAHPSAALTRHKANTPYEVAGRTTSTLLATLVVALYLAVYTPFSMYCHYSFN